MVVNGTYLAEAGSGAGPLPFPAAERLQLPVPEPGLEKWGARHKDYPFYQIGAEQGFLPQVVRIQTGFATRCRATV